MALDSQELLPLSVPRLSSCYTQLTGRTRSPVSSETLGVGVFEVRIENNSAMDVCRLPDLGKELQQKPVGPAHTTEAKHTTGEGLGVAEATLHDAT